MLSASLISTWGHARSVAFGVKPVYLICILIGIFCGIPGGLRSSLAQTVYDWRSDAPDEFWRQGAAGARWDPGGLWNEPPPGNILRFNNNHRPVTTNNVAGTYNIHQIIFGSSATVSRTNRGNAVRLYDFSGADPKIENLSTGHHAIEHSVEGDGDFADPLEINPINGSLTIRGSLNNQGSPINIWGNNGWTVSLFGVVSGAGGLTVLQNSTVILTNNNTFSGDINIFTGAVEAGRSPSALGSGSIFIRATGTALRLRNDANISFNRNTTINTNTTISVGRYSSGSGITSTMGTLTINASTLRVAVGPNVSSGSAGLTFGNTTFSATPPTFDIDDNVVLTLGSLQSSGNFTKTGLGQLILGSAAGAGRTSGTLTIQAGKVRFGNVDNPIGPAACSITLAGGELELGRTGLTLNEYPVTVTGDARITPDRAGTSPANHSNRLGTLSIGAHRLTVIKGAFVQSPGTSTLQLAATTLSGDAIFAVSNETRILFNSTISLGSHVMTVTGAGEVVASGAISGSGGLAVQGPGLVVLLGVNTYTGSTVVNGGTLRMSGVDRLSSNTAVTVGSAGTFDLSNNNTRVASLAGSGSVTLGSGHLTIAGNSSTTFGGTISGTGGLGKEGTGTLTLSGNNTYSGPTTVSNGTLLVSGSIPNSAVLVITGATLSGTGTVGNLTIGGLVSPGNSAGSTGVLTAGSITLQSGGGYTFDISNVSGSPGTHWDVVTGSGVLTVPPSGTFTIYLNGNPAGFNSAGSYAWTIMNGSSISGFDPSRFAVNTAGFTPSFGGSFSVAQSGTNLQLVYSPPGASPPIVTTTEASDTNLTWATSGGNVTSDGGASVTNRGVVWSTSPGPTVPGAQTTNGAGTGVFTAIMTNLVPGVTYYYRAFAQNSAGTGYGSEFSLTTPCYTAGPTVTAASGIGYTNFTANWLALAGATSYRLDVATSSTFSASVSVTNFYESMGTSGANGDSIATHESNNRFDNVALTMSGSGDMRNTFPSSGYPTASGGFNVMLNAPSENFIIAGIDSSGLSNMRIRFGVRKSTNAEDGSSLALEASTNGTDWVSCGTISLPTGTGTATWYYRTNDVPASMAGTNMRIRFQSSSSVEFRIDDVMLTGDSILSAFVPGYSNRVVTGTSALVTGLTDGVTYYYRVRAVGGGTCVSPNSDTQSVTTLAYNPPGIGIGGNLAATSTIGGAVTLSFAVTNVGQRLLSYQITNNAPAWLVVSPTAGVSIAESNSQSHSLTLWATNLAAGVHTGRVVVFNTGVGPNTASNSPQLFDVVFTVNAITSVLSAGVTNDGNEFVRLGWTKSPAFDVLILHRETNAPAAPINGTLYNVGDVISGHTRVIYKGAGSNLQHVVRPGSTNHYAFHSIFSNHYSSVVSASATVGIYGVSEIVEVFAYTSGVQAFNLGGGSGWGTNIWVGDTNRFSVSNLSFSAIADYPTPRANKIAVSPLDGETLGISRRLATPISDGRIYVGYIVNFEYAGSGKYVGVQLFSNTTERLFAGEVSTADLRLGIDGTSSTRVMNNGFGQDYLVILRYDWAAGQAVASAFKIGTDSVPTNEPATWDISVTKASNLVGQINAVRLVAGTTGSGTPGTTYFDELRVATTWEDLLGISPPGVGPVIYDGFASSSGTLNGGGGGSGWSNFWILGGDPYADYSSGSFHVTNSSYPPPTGNKVVLYGDVNGRTVLATRAFAQPFTNGTVYFAWIQNYQYNGTDKFAGIRLMQGSTEKAFIGKVAAANQALGIAESSANAVSSNNLLHGVGNDYVIVAKYDFATRELSATSYKLGSDSIAEEPKGYWQVTTTQSFGHITSLTGVRLAIGAASSVQIGHVYYDEIRVGTNWYQVTRRDGEAQFQAMANGPVPRLLYVGTNYNISLNPQGASNDITVTDADLANTSDPLDIAVLWSNQFGVFLTNANGSLNIGSRAGRVNPNFDPVVLAGTGSQFQSFGFDAPFTNWIGVNGATVVTTYQRQAFSITNSSFDDTFYITLSAENNNMGGGVTNAPNGADPIPLWRALTVNTALQFFVKDDDPNPPELFEFTLDGVGGSGSSNLLPGAVALIGLNGAHTQERFSFVVLAPFPAGTRLLFTDCGWDANSNNWYNLNEFHTNTWVASGNMDVGTVVELTITNINNAGDQIVVYQYNGTASPTTDPDNITFLYALNLGPGWFTNLAYPGGGTNNQNSMLYRGLTNGVNAVSVPIAPNPVNARYIGPTTGTASYLLSQISNSNNWQSFPSGYLDITNYSFNVIGPGDFDWNSPELSDAQVLAGGYRVTNVVRDLDAGLIATNKPFGHAPYFMLLNTNGSVIVSNIFPVNFADGTKTPVTNRVSAPAGTYSNITLGTVTALTAVADMDNDRSNDTQYRTNRLPVLVYDDDPDPPIVGPGGVALMIGTQSLASTNRTELVAAWNFNNAGSRMAVSHGSGTLVDTLISTNSNTGTSLNSYENDPAGDDLTVQGSGNIGRSLRFDLDMSGRKDLVVSFAARRSSTGYDSNRIEVAVGSGPFVVVNANWAPALDTWGTHTFDLSSYTNLNGAPQISFRITFGTNAVSGLGNNRFDNFQFNAGYITYYEVTDGALATVGSTNPIRFSFNAYDTYSGLARGTAFDGTNMAVTVGGLATNNTAAYQAGLSSASTTGAASTSVWQFTSISYSQIGDLHADGKSNRPIRATMADLDNDRPSDAAYRSNTLFGIWRVIDDDTNTPVLADLTFPNAAARPFVVLTNGGTFAAGETMRSLDRRSGTGTNTVWTLSDGDLAASGSIGLQFAFGARDVDSGVSRGNTGSTNTVMSFSIGSVMVGNVSNYNASLSSAQTATNQVLTNIWSFGGGVFGYSYIGSLMATNIHLNPLATTTRPVWVTIPDTDDDRPNDRMTLISHQVGFVRIADDDARGPVIASAVAEGTTGNETNFLETFEPATGWTNTVSFSGSWTNTVSNGTYIASGEVLWGSLNPKVSGTRRIGLLTNAAATNTWLQLPPVRDPGTFTVFAGRFGPEEPTNDVAVWLERLDGSTWTNLGTHLVGARNPEFEMLSWNVNVDGVVTLRLVRAATGVQVYMDDINITPNPEWVSTNQLTIRWTAAVDDFSGVDEYRLVMPAVGTTVPSTTNAGSGISASVTSHTASILHQEGIITGFVFAVDDDNDRPADRAIGNLKPLVVRVDTSPPPRATQLRATDAAAGYLFDPSIDESSEIKVEWRPGGTNEAQAAGWRSSDSSALSPWDSYIVRYYEVLDTNGTPAPNALTITLTRTSAGYSNALGNWAFTNLVLSNLQFDTYYRIEIQGRDLAGNIGLATSVIGNTDRFIVTQGLTRANLGLDLKWTGPTNESVLRDYDVIFIDSPHGFRNTLTSQWQFLQYTNRPRLSDFGGTNRVAPGLLTGTTYRFYRVARQDRWKTNQNPRVGSAEIYVAKALRMNPGENWYSLFSFPDPATTNEMESTVAYVFGTNTLPAGTTFASSTRISWFAHSNAINHQGSAPTCIVWLSSSAGWIYQLGGTGNANNKRVPLGQGFLIELPTNALPTNLVLVGRLATQALVRTIPAVSNTNAPEFHVLSQQMAERIPVSNFVKQFSGFQGGVHPNFADEIRILNNQPTNGLSQGSLTQPRMRIWLSTLAVHSNAPWRLATSGSPNTMPSAMSQIIEPDDAIIIVRRKPSVVIWTNAPTYSAPTKNFSP
ncbi:MAG: autotransporter-associated beta strand repeat-containing protein [Kiritimatiellae bacterium]|nr:autotransporter-associated beta strand repeat-containing protein [Kiritimatiellia bacterium]MDW8458011.1 autotransporter-associated beta strand repeat-containing protein [Verrucomicrobiota bacterium]